jgi:hypothetical protein
MEAATGDKDFWIVDVVGNFCFVHPAKAGISSNLNLITDKGNIYSFTLQDVSGTSDTPDLKVLIVPADHSSIVAASGPPQFVPTAQLEQTRQQLATLQSHVEQAVDEYKSAYQRPPGPAQFAIRLRLHLPRQPRGNPIYRRHDQAQPATRRRYLEDFCAGNYSNSVHRSGNRDRVNLPNDISRTVSAPRGCL